MRKILFIVTQSEFGGAQRYIFEVARGLDSVKYEVLVAAGSGDGELFQKLKDTPVAPVYAPVRPVYLRRMKRTPWPWQIILAIGEIFNLLKKERPDVLFLCSTTAGLLGSIAGFLYRDRVSVIYRIGGWAFRDPRHWWMNKIILWTEKITAPLKDKIIVNSEIDRKLALKYKIAPAEKIVKIYNGIDAEKLDFLSREEARKNLLGSDSSKLWIGCVANFYKTKGLEYLVEAASPLNSNLKSQNSKLLIIGEGRQRPKLEALITKYNLQKKVLLLGRIPDAYKYLKAFDVFVLPSLKEGFPWIILEAIAAKVPMVASKVGALPEILPEEFLVEPGNAEALAKKISRMLEHPAIPKLKQEFTLQKMIEETEKLL